jgi:hypothetical protein
MIQSPQLHVATVELTFDRCAHARIAPFPELLRVFAPSWFILFFGLKRKQTAKKRRSEGAKKTKTVEERRAR